jgi:hypothetical protein
MAAVVNFQFTKKSEQHGGEPLEVDRLERREA